jgi:hypothetical protein
VDQDITAHEPRTREVFSKLEYSHYLTPEMSFTLEVLKISLDLLSHGGRLKGLLSKKGLAG